MASYRLHKGYTAKGTFNTYMDYAYEDSRGRTKRVFKGHHLKFIKGNDSGFVQEGRTPDNMILPSTLESRNNVDYRTFSSIFRIIIMFVLLLSYCKIVFGGVDISPFDTGIELAQEISRFGSGAKTDFIDTLQDLKDDFASMNRLSIANWGTIDSIGTFFSSVGSMFTAPFNLFKFIFSMIVYIIKLITGLSNIIVGV